MRKVAKFGGTSTASSNQFQKIKAIVKQDPMRSIIVVSACGKRNNEDNKITDLLYLCHAHLKYSVSCLPIWKLIEERFLAIKQELQLTFPIELELIQIKKQLSKNISEDFLVSRGEYLCALLMADYLNYTFVDASEVICLDFDGKIDYEASQIALNKYLTPTSKLVIPGFYGTLPSGEIKVLKRGGSDVSGALIASLTNASLYENWTDVSGILAANPKIVDNPKPLTNISYEEARILAYMGASVLHEEALFPTMIANIPICIKNTNQPDESGTIIDSTKKNNTITSIVGKCNYTMITIYKKQLTTDPKMLPEVLLLLNKDALILDQLVCNIDSFTLIVQSESIKFSIPDLLVNLMEITNADLIQITPSIALIVLLGSTYANLLSLVEKLTIPIFTQQYYEHTLMISLREALFESTIKQLYLNAYQ